MKTEITLLYDDQHSHRMSGPFDTFKKKLGNGHGNHLGVNNSRAIYIISLDLVYALSERDLGSNL